DDEGDVVTGGCALRELGQGGFDLVADAGGGRVEVARDYVVEAERAELFALWVLRLGHAVRVDDERVAGLELGLAFAVGRGLEDAERHAARAELFHRAGGVDDERRVMARVDEGERARL